MSDSSTDNSGSLDSFVVLQSSLSSTQDRDSLTSEYMQSGEHNLHTTADTRLNIEANRAESNVCSFVNSQLPFSNQFSQFLTESADRENPDKGSTIAKATDKINLAEFPSKALTGENPYTFDDQYTYSHPRSNYCEGATSNMAMAESVHEYLLHDSDTNMTNSVDNDEYSRTVLVENLNSETTYDAIELYFENRKRSGGGDLELLHDKNTASARITFQSADVAARVLEKQHTLDKAELVVRRPSPPKVIEDPLEDSGACGEEMVSVIVTGFGEMDLDTLSLFFESQKRSGGGSIQEDVNIDEKKLRAIIKFDEAEVASRVASRSPFTFQGHELVVVLAPPKPKPDPYSIKVKGLKNTTGTETIEMYFESKKRTGGGEIKTITLNANTDEAVITFEEEIAKRVAELSQETRLMLEGVPLTVEVYVPEAQLTIPAIPKPFIPNPHVVIVENIPSNATEDTVQLFFESPKRSAGGEMESFKLHPEKGIAVITFQDPSVAQAVLTKEAFEVAGGKVTVRCEKPSSSAESVLEDDPLISFTGEFTKVELHGIPTKVEEDYLKMFLENKKKSEGGELVTLKFCGKRHMATVEFKYAKDAVSLYKNTKLNIEGAGIQVVPLNTCLEHDPSYQGSQAIRVSNIPQDVTKSHLELFFENRRKSGGGPVAEVFSLENGSGAIIITFAEASIAARVEQKHETTQLKIQGSYVTIERLQPAPPPPLCLVPKETDRWLLTGVSAITRTKDIDTYFAQFADCSVKGVQYSLKPGVALVVLRGYPEYEDLLRLCCSKPLMGNMVSIQEIPLPTAIQVYSKVKIKMDMLELYFESTNRSGGGDVVDFMCPEDESYAIVTFRNSEVLKNVLNRKHTVEQQRLDVQIYYPEFGVVPPDHDTSQPGVKMPQPLLFDLPNAVGKFILRSADARELLGTYIKETHGEFDWAKSSDDVLHVNCTLTRGTKNLTSLVNDWSQKTQPYLQSQIDGLIAVKEIEMLQDVFVAVLKSAQEMCKTQPLDINPNMKKCSILIVGLKPDVEKLVDELNKLVDDKEAILKKKKVPTATLR